MEVGRGVGNTTGRGEARRELDEQRQTFKVGLNQLERRGES